jgi:hypothetical protein
VHAAREHFAGLTAPRVSSSSPSSSSSRPFSVAIFGQETERLVLKCATAMLAVMAARLQSTTYQQQHELFQQLPSVIVVDRSLERLLAMAQRLPPALLNADGATSNSYGNNNSSNSGIGSTNKMKSGGRFVFVRSTDPYFALLHTVPDRHLQRVVVSFPAPCPSDDQSYRRVVHAPFFQLAHQKLALGGDVVVATDFLPLHKFHERQLAVSEAGVSWGRVGAMRAAANRAAALKEASAYSAAYRGGRNAASKSQQQQQQQTTDAAAAANPLDVATLPTLEDAPTRVRFAATAAATTATPVAVHTLRRVKDRPTPDHVVLQNVSHATVRTRYGALTQ